VKFAPKRVAGFAASALLAAGLLIAPALTPFPAAAPIPTASAACPDAEVDFARGREEAPGVGEVGQAFINSLQSKVPHMSIGEYGVNYPADVSVTTGSNDMSAHVQQMAASCPNTKLVIGGYSLGAAAADVVVAMNKPGFGYTDVLPPNLDQHVAAVALFGNGTRAVLGPVPTSAPPSPERPSTCAPPATRSAPEECTICIGRAICSRRTSAPGWWTTPPASSPASCSRG
jgi:cutinase-like protein